MNHCEPSKGDVTRGAPDRGVAWPRTQGRETGKVRKRVGASGAGAGEKVGELGERKTGRQGEADRGK